MPVYFVSPPSLSWSDTDSLACCERPAARAPARVYPPTVSGEEYHRRARAGVSGDAVSLGDADGFLLGYLKWTFP